jgi:cobalt-zinc-cadmium efflux system outer membrane protein
MKKSLLLPLFCSALVVCSAQAIAAPGDDVLSRLKLTDAEQLWQQKNREVQLARDQVAGANADRLSAAQRPNPQLSLNTGSLTRNSVLKESDIVVRIDQTFERGGKRELRMRGADLRLDAAREDMADTARQSRITLHQAYYDVLLVQEKLAITESNARLYAQTVDAAKLRLQVGDIAKSELSRIQVDALRAENDVRQAHSDLRQAQVTLAYLIGAEADATLIHAADNWPDAQLPPAADAVDVDQRPDVRSALLHVQAAEAARDLANSLKTRDVTIGAQFERNGSSTPTHSIGFGVSIPLMTGYEYQGEIGHAEADLQAARDALEQVRAQAMSEIARYRDSLENAAERLQRFDGNLLAEATNSLEAAEFAYRHGALSVMDLLDARRTYKATLLDTATARADYAKSLAAWHQATGESK